MRIGASCPQISPACFACFVGSKWTEWTLDRWRARRSLTRAYAGPPASLPRAERDEGRLVDSGADRGWVRRWCGGHSQQDTSQIRPNRFLSDSSYLLLVRETGFERRSRYLQARPGRSGRSRRGSRSRVDGVGAGAHRPGSAGQGGERYVSGEKGEGGKIAFSGTSVVIPFGCRKIIGDCLTWVP